MNDVNLRRVDLNLLTVFEAVYEEQSQIKAAERLGMTQPAVSHALGRLRYLVGDRLFQGRTKGLTPTSQADDLYQRVHQALDLIRAEFAARNEFDPLSSRRTFVVALGYGSGALFGVRLFQRISSLAPQSRLVIRTIDPAEEIPELLREHRLDLVFNPSRFEDAMLEQPIAWESRLAVVARKDHPRIGSSPSLEEVLGENYAWVYGTAITTEEDSVRDFLKAVHQRAMIEVPNALLLPMVLESTDLLAITTSRFADFMSQKSNIKSYPFPMESKPLNAYLIWHRSMTADPANQWLREQVQAVLKDIEMSTCLGSERQTI